jgi:hypothetical protein
MNLLPTNPSGTTFVVALGVRGSSLQTWETVNTTAIGTLAKGTVL